MIFIFFNKSPDTNKLLKTNPFTGKLARIARDKRLIKF